MLTYPDSCQHWLPHSWGYMTVLIGNGTGSDLINISQPEVYSLGYNPQRGWSPGRRYVCRSRFSIVRKSHHRLVL